MTIRTLVDGAFDPLHAGHVAYLHAAADLGRPLFCAVATDEYVQTKRPVLLPALERMRVVQALGCVDQVGLNTGGLPRILSELKPQFYVKGADWAGRLPQDILDAAREAGTAVHFVPTVQDSSSRRLRAWREAADERALGELERIVYAQMEPDQWRPVTPYDYETRKAIEGRTPELIRAVLQPKRVLDVGCGHDGHLVRMLREAGVRAFGIDREKPVAGIGGAWDLRWFVDDLPDRYRSDVVICREVLEHLPLRDWPVAVANLCQMTTRLVYLTTRLHPAAVSAFDVATADDLDPTHISLPAESWLRSLFVLNRGKRRRDLEEQLDWQHKGRVFCYEVAR